MKILIEKFNKSYSDTKNRLLKEIMRQSLGREPVSGDANDFKVVQQFGSEKELVNFKGKSIGVIETDFSKKTLEIRFTPYTQE